jgi:hypothetical protein
MKRFVKSIYKKTDQQKRQDDMTQRELERIERVRRYVPKCIKLIYYVDGNGRKETGEQQIASETPTRFK